MASPQIPEVVMASHQIPEWLTSFLAKIFILNPEWFSAIFAGAAILFTIITFLRTRTTLKSQVFIDLRYRFIEIFDKLPTGFRSENWLPQKGSEDWVKIQQYWYHVFNEWFVTNKLDRWYLKPLWNKYYRIAIWNGLEHDPLRAVLIDMISDRMNFAGYSAEFEKVLGRIWEKYSPKSTPSLRKSVRDLPHDKNSTTCNSQTSHPC